MDQPVVGNNNAFVCLVSYQEAYLAGVVVVEQDTLFFVCTSFAGAQAHFASQQLLYFHLPALPGGVHLRRRRQICRMDPCTAAAAAAA
eukprot:CAMPEP_0175158282 /NCGR_PEP_ID=MMETSP0087-20121206/22720_1 /TAXON_ID=136419 /ORGANISM="Unknown Unknown, Strain D1" /LENGTH=87 /DNA_ID=CAMNT_0016446083 /DNA_START=172 /DNA_END=432 /DNA_ORIENTATION=-